MILITGATGQLGQDVINQLLGQVASTQLIGLARNKIKAETLKQKGVQVRFGDYGRKATLDRAFEGVEKLLLITSNGEDAYRDHQRVIDAAQRAKVRHLFYVSGALNRNVINSRLGPLTASYIDTEVYLKASGLPYTIFQSGLYAETIPFFIGKQPIENGLFFPAGEGKASFAKRVEMAEAMANVLVSGGHENKTYILTENQSYSFADIARMLADLSGKPVHYNDPEPAVYTSTLEQLGVNQDQIDLAALFAAVIKNHEYNVFDSTLERLLGRQPVCLKAYLNETFLM